MAKNKMNKPHDEVSIERPMDTSSTERQEQGNQKGQK